MFQKRHEQLLHADLQSAGAHIHTHMLCIAASSVLGCASDYGQCGGDGWDGQRCCAGNECQTKDEYYSQCIPVPKANTATATAQRTVITSVNLDTAGEHGERLQAAAADLEASAAWSHEVSVGLLEVAHPLERPVQVIRNTGGGTSRCCKQHPVAAGARVHGSALQVQLEPRTPKQIDAWSSRNGARVYLASSPSSSGQARARHFGEVEYVAWDLLDKRLEFTIDLSAAACGCNAAFYLVSLKQNSRPGNCGGDRYCDANAVCGVRCAEIDVLEGAWLLPRRVFYTVP